MAGAAMSTHPVLRVIRLTLETNAPLSIASGSPSLTEDVVLARDPNGLPLIPATSLTGVLRSGLKALTSEEEACDLFGDPLQSKSPRPGRLTISDALCLGEQQVPIDGMDILPPNDRVFSLLVERPTTRDHVRLNSRGSVDGSGKFTRAAVPRGARFLAQLEIWEIAGDGSDDPAWTALFNALSGPLSRLRLGGATRSGYGGVSVVDIENRAFDMRISEDREAAQLTVSLSQPLHGETTQIVGSPATEETYSLALSPEGSFRFGQGQPSVEDQEPADLRPIRETVINWSVTPPSIIEDRLFVPASAIKGALRHRTAFHLRRLMQKFVGVDFDEEELLAPLFGIALDDDGGTETRRGTAGRVFIDDIPIANAKVRRIHRTSIDRFSGGVRRGALFSEDAVECDTPLRLSVQIENAGDVDAQLLTAFEHALADLAHGWLPLGAGGARGLGVFHDPSPDERLAHRFAERMQT